MKRWKKQEEETGDAILCVCLVFTRQVYTEYKLNPIIFYTGKDIAYSNIILYYINWVCHFSFLIVLWPTKI